MGDVCKFIDKNKSDWTEHRNLILDQLEKMSDKLNRLQESINELKIHNTENRLMIEHLKKEVDKKSFLPRTLITAFAGALIATIFKIIKNGD